MNETNDLEELRAWLNKPWKKFAKGLGINTATLWRWRKTGVPAGPPTILVERLKAEMAIAKADPWDNLTAAKQKEPTE